ncbi:MAG: hypothetical protein AB7S48_07120 [Bacteroidales bacterium]
MKRILFIMSLLLIIAIKIYSQNSLIFARVGIKDLQIGYNFEPLKKINIPMSIGLSSNFIETKYNDFSVEVWPNFQFQRRNFRFPLGFLTGVKWVKTYDYSYTVFNYGLYSGVSYRFGKNEIGLNAGVKFGKRRYIIESQTSIGNISAYETYKENPLLLMITYSFLIK